MKFVESQNVRSDQMNQKLDIVITMGGLGSRFRKAGYKVPKYMINVNGKTLFEWSMISLSGFMENAAQFIFIAMRDESSDVEGFIKEQCKKIGINNYHIILLDYLTDGQATTAMLAEKYWIMEHGLLIYNIDTYVEAGEMNSEQLCGDGFIPCFKAAGDHWSFVKTDASGKAVEIKEKERISENCTLGAYYFRSCQLYMDLYHEYYDKNKNLVNGEKYVAPLYNHLLSRNGEIYISDINPQKVHVLGTPEELDAFINRCEK